MFVFFQQDGKSLWRRTLHKMGIVKDVLSFFISEASLFWDVSFKVSVFFGSVPCPDSHIQIPRFLIFQPSKNRHFLRIWTSLIRLRWSIRSRYNRCLRWHFLGTHAYEIKSIDCLLKPEFVLVPTGNFENIPIALLRCTTIATFGRKYKTTIEGVFVSAFCDIRFRLSLLIFILFTYLLC